MIETLRIVEDDLTGEEIAALLHLHLDDLQHLSPPESVHAFSIERLKAPDVTFWSAWDRQTLAACGALKQLDVVHGEIKSMRAAPAYRGKGAGKAILRHLLVVAQERGYTRVSLETGTGDAFVPAQSLYRSHGFTDCPPFAAYSLDPFSCYMTREL